MAGAFEAARSWITIQAESAQGELAARLNSIASDHEKKLWHQLTVKIMDLLTWEPMKSESSNALIIDLGEQFLKSFRSRINPLKLAQITALIVARYSDPKQQMSVLEAVVEVARDSDEAVVYAKSYIARALLALGQTLKCRDVLDELKVQLEGVVADSSVYVAFYQAKAEYHKVNGPFEEYYHNGLMILGYLPLSEYSLEEQQEMAFMLCVAALVGEGVYSFGELLLQPILGSLKDTEREWIVHVVNAFNDGDIRRYNELQQQYKEQLNGQSVLLSHVQELKEKISVLCLMELVFKRPSEERTIPFAVIADVTQLPLNDVELLLMKTLASKLVRGTIDQVNQEASFTWVQPRALRLEQIATLRDRIEHWQGKTHSLLVDVETRTKDLCQQ